MPRLIKFWFSGLLMGFGITVAWGFSPGGPIGNDPKPSGLGTGDSYQTPSIGYNLPGDILGPKNIGQEYRRNVPVMYYTYDDNFLSYFDANNSTNGTAAVDAAMAVFNNLTNVDQYSTQLNEFPLNTEKYNYSAQALGLTDLKSSTMSLIVEEMGLASPARYVWTLHDRYIPPGGTCPLDVEYIVIQRNLDPVSKIYSSYINGTLYTYEIAEFCKATAAGQYAQTVPYPVDNLGDEYTAVADAGLEAGGGISTVFGAGTLGGFYTGLTRDDVGGLRYMWSTNNIHREDPSFDSTSITTNFTSTQFFPVNSNSPTGYGTFDLGALIGSSRTNPPAVLQALFPGVVVATSTSQQVLVTNQTVVSYFTNFLGSQVGLPPVLVVATNYSLGVATIYSDTFANVLTNNYSPSTTYQVQTITVGPIKGGQVGGPSVTNVTYQSVVVPNMPSGDYYILPTNLCGIDIISTVLTNVFTVTNSITSASTNATTTSTNTATYGYSQNTVTTLTNFIYNIYPVNCSQSTNAADLYAGIGRIQFVRADYDSLIGQFWQPVTNSYNISYVTNSQYHLRSFQRILTGPDILFSAEDLTTGQANITGFGLFEGERTVPAWDQANAGVGLAGPGTINPSSPTKIAFNDVGDVYGSFGLGFNGLATNGFLSEVDFFSMLAWGSYDGSTNPPVVYPDAAALGNLQNQIVVQISPASLPNGTNGVFYTPITFTASGGSFSPPFTWFAGPVPGITGSGLPAGMILSSGGVLSGTPSGNPSGTYDFIVQINDVNGRSVQWNYSMVIQ